MVKDHWDSERGNMLLPHRLLFSINSKGSFICTIPDRIAHTTTFVTPVAEHWLEWEIALWVHHEGSIWWPIAPWANALTTELHLARIFNGHLFVQCSCLLTSVVSSETENKYFCALKLCSQKVKMPFYRSQKVKMPFYCSQKVKMPFYRSQKLKCLSNIVKKLKCLSTVVKS